MVSLNGNTNNYYNNEHGQYGNTLQHDDYEHNLQYDNHQYGNHQYGNNRNNNHRNSHKTTTHIIIHHDNKRNHFSMAEKVNVLLWPILVVLLIIAYIVYVMKFNDGNWTLAPSDKESKDPKRIFYSNKYIDNCPNLKTVGVKSYKNANDKTVYSITGNKNHPYNNAISLRSGRPDRGFYDCDQSGYCLTYTFITKNEKCTDRQNRLTLKTSDNCIGGYGCHYKTDAQVHQQDLHTYCSGMKTCPKYK